MWFYTSITHFACNGCTVDAFQIFTIIKSLWPYLGTIAQFFTSWIIWNNHWQLGLKADQLGLKVRFTRDWNINNIWFIVILGLEAWKLLANHSN